jgi:glycosyltransferase involved in cell wall biosynthesis
VELIPPGLDRQRLAASALRGDAEAAWRGAGLVSDGRKRILMVARLQRFKGPLDFVDMAAAVAEERPAQFLIIGPDSPQEPTLRKEIGERIRLRGLSSVVALAGRLSTDDLAATVEAADLLVHPARRETFGLVVLEALALGTPAIAYDSPGPSLILASGGGRVVPAGDIAMLSSTVLEALGDPALLNRWRKEARSGAARFDLSVVVDRYLAVFERLAAGRSRTWSLRL